MEAQAQGHFTLGTLGALFLCFRLALNGYAGKIKVVAVKNLMAV